MQFITEKAEQVLGISDAIKQKEQKCSDNQIIDTWSQLLREKMEMEGLQISDYFQVRVSSHPLNFQRCSASYNSLTAGLMIQTTLSL